MNIAYYLDFFVLVEYCLKCGISAGVLFSFSFPGVPSRKCPNFILFSNENHVYFFSFYLSADSIVKCRKPDHSYTSKTKRSWTEWKIRNWDHWILWDLLANFAPVFWKKYMQRSRIFCPFDHVCLCVCVCVCVYIVKWCSSLTTLILVC